MTVQQAILERRSIRKFAPTPLTSEQLEHLAAAALASPSGLDRQPWQFHFVQDRSVLTLLSEAGFETFGTRGDQAVLERLASRGASNLFYGAPLLVVLSTPADSPSLIEVGIAAQTLVLSAQGLGLGSCYIGLAAAAFSGPSADRCKIAIGLGAERAFALAVAIGTPAMSKEAHPVHPEKIIWV